MSNPRDIKKAETTKCEHCIDGVWARRWIADAGGGFRPVGGTGDCFQCGGKGHQTAADRRRNEAYRRYAINRELSRM